MNHEIQNMMSRQDLLTDNFMSVARELKEQQTARMAGDSDLVRRIEDMKQFFIKEMDDVRSVTNECVLQFFYCLYL